MNTYINNIHKIVTYDLIEGIQFSLKTVFEPIICVIYDHNDRYRDVPYVRCVWFFCSNLLYSYL